MSDMKSSSTDNRKEDGFIARAQKRDKWLPLSILAVAVVSVMSRNTKPMGFNLDFIAFCAFLVLIAWLLWPSTQDGAGEQDH